MNIEDKVESLIDTLSEKETKNHKKLLSKRNKIEKLQNEMDQLQKKINSTQRKIEKLENKSDKVESVDKAIQLMKHFMECTKKNPGKIHATVMLVDLAECDYIKDTFLCHMTKTKGVTFDSYGNDINIDYDFTLGGYKFGELKNASRKTSFLQIKKNIEDQHPNTKFDLFAIEDKSSWEVILEEIGYNSCSISGLKDKICLSDGCNGTFTSCIPSEKHLIIKYDPSSDKFINTDSDSDDM